MSKPKRLPHPKRESTFRDVSARWVDPYNPHVVLCHDCWEKGGKNDLGYQGWTGMRARHILRHDRRGYETPISFCGIDFSGQGRGTTPGQGRLILDS